MIFFVLQKYLVTTNIHLIFFAYNYFYCQWFLNVAQFSEYIEKTTAQVKQKIEWVLNGSRRTDILKQLWKTLIQGQIDYCSQLYISWS